jgi:predicted Zn finger-like uncharacterized protein
MILNCPHCENEFYIHDELAGVTVNCHKCKKPVDAPAKTVVTSNDEDSVAGDYDLPAAPKAKTHIKARPGSKPHKHKRINLIRGFRRLTLLLSVLLGPVIFLGVAIRGVYSFNNYLIFIYAAFGFLDSLNPTLRVTIEYALFWVGGFLVVWAIYGLLWFVTTGFFEVIDVEKSMND